jgi:predicted metal-binding membrane protein
VPEAATTVEHPPTILESALRSERVTAILLLIVFPVACWAWIIVMARDMYGSLSGASQWMMTPSWDVPHLVLLWAMWAVMMTAMMLPSAAPAMLMFGLAARRRHGRRAAGLIYSLAAGYVTVWALFSLLATAVHRTLATQFLVSSMMEMTSAAAGATLLIAAGMYQLTPLKEACLRACQSPLGFLMRRWRDGWFGAFRMGLEHGLYCLGCCWALMLLLFVGGVMNLAVIGGLTAFVAVEKLRLLGRQGARISGIVLVVFGLWMFTR